MSITEIHVVSFVDLDNRRESLALIRVEAIINQLPAFSHPRKAVPGCGVCDFIHPGRRNLKRGAFHPFGSENIPHMPRLAIDRDKRVSNKKRLM